MSIEITSPIGVVCHDSGGANQILAMFNSPNCRKTLVYFEGPARELWRQMGSPCEHTNNQLQLFSKVRTLVTGTGWATRLEHEAREEARRRGIYSIAVLDHWVNYYERFVRDGNLVLPDEIWVVDEFALEIAQKTFPGLPIVLQPDRYAEQLVKQIEPISLFTSNEILYLMEPLRSNWGREEAGEFQALRYFLELLPKTEIPVHTRITLRPHPSDAIGKYDSFLGEWNGYRVVLDTGDLVGALSRARWVAGCNTYAMTIALRAGRIVFGALPPWAPQCCLPHDGIIHLRNVF